MNRYVKSAVLGLAVAATTLTALPAAQAGDGWRRHGDWGGRRHHSRNGDLVAAGVIGLAVGALVAGAANASQPDYYEPVPIYREPRPRPHPDRGYYIERPPVVYERPPAVYERPQVVYADRYAAAEPWTRDWFEYCSSRYRSFNPRTGTFVGYDGMRHFCQAN
ncbi:MAG: BA14K family protein [Rhizobiaceae bacterium]|nr:BA14K family protein [Rhizobiaceae bacterium]